MKSANGFTQAGLVPPFEDRSPTFGSEEFAPLRPSRDDYLNQAVSGSRPTYTPMRRSDASHGEDSLMSGIESSLNILPTGAEYNPSSNDVLRKHLSERAIAPARTSARKSSSVLKSGQDGMGSRREEQRMDDRPYYNSPDGPRQPRFRRSSPTGTEYQQVSAPILATSTEMSASQTPLRPTLSLAPPNTGDFPRSKVGGYQPSAQPPFNRQDAPLASNQENSFMREESEDAPTMPMNYAGATELGQADPSTAPEVKPEPEASTTFTAGIPSQTNKIIIDLTDIADSPPPRRSGPRSVSQVHHHAPDLENVKVEQTTNSSSEGIKRVSRPNLRPTTFGKSTLASENVSRWLSSSEQGIVDGLEFQSDFGNEERHEHLQQFGHLGKLKVQSGHGEAEQGDRYPTREGVSNARSEASTHQHQVQPKRNNLSTMDWDHNSMRYPPQSSYVSPFLELCRVHY